MERWRRYEIYGNINEELLVYEERLEEGAQQREAKRLRATGSHRVSADEDDLYRRGQGARLVEGAVRQMVPRGEEARLEIGEEGEGKGEGEGGEIAAGR